MSRTSATYLYCAVRCEEAPPTGGAPAGLPGLSEPRALPVRSGLWLIAADAPLPEHGAEAIRDRLQNLSWVSERALAHEAMVEHFGKLGTVLPMKLFTLFDSDERAVEPLRADSGRIDRLFERIAGCQEWGVLVRFDESRAREAVAGEARQEAGGQSAGTAFLLRKKGEQDAARNLLARLHGMMDEVFAELSDRAEEARRREPAAPSALLLDGAFLVRSEQAEGFEKAVDGWAARLARSACEVTLTGPWPAYNFLEETP